MNLKLLAELIEQAIDFTPPSALTDMCQDYYQPYYYLMYLLAANTDPADGDIVELGVNKGYGIASFAYGNPDIKVIGLDLNVSPIYCPDNVDFHLVSALPVPDFIGKVSVLHIDTEHSYGNALNEFGQYEPYLIPGAVVLFDDLHAMDSDVARAFYELPYTKIQEDRLHPGNGYGVMLI